ncbi:unnamed protein product [Pseudo-nitzschia multistriata]|uniref:Uncharacterized protein n=1 Tax=Pseudo-nitzschia multistriata TaxID=183589 RepID=A0A448ZRX9_9STRA|nr:unnamed protein product [Pseudo-nitzschia multistriata]
MSATANGGSGNASKAPAVSTGTPTGPSRLSNYSFVIGTTLICVFVVTLSSMETLTSHFGNLAGMSSPGSSSSTIEIKEIPGNKIDTGSSLRKKSKSSKRSKKGSATLVKSGADGAVNPAIVNWDVVNEPKKEGKPKEEKESKTDESGSKKKQGIENGNGNNDSSSPTPFTSALDSVIDARKDMIKKLKKQYGKDNFDTIFRYDKEADDASNNEKYDGGVPTHKKLQMKYRPIRPLAPKDLYRTNHWGKESDELKEYFLKSDAKYWNSVENLQRKMMIKLLLQKAPDAKGKSSNKYVWATGGHSAAAGHGNLFKESYTKVMEATAVSVFDAAGLELEARNFAMGATSSAAEMSMCFKEVYGDDVDIFSWDFGMLEARYYLSGRLLHYATRGFLSNQQDPQSIVPAFVGLQELDESRRKSMVELHDAFRGTGSYAEDSLAENNGLALFLTDTSYWKIMTEAVPETSGLTSAEIEELPELVRYFKCNGGIEKGDPFCGEKKYSEEVCPKRDGQVSWHPGWKYHALLGNSMALFLTEMLLGSVTTLEKEVREIKNGKGISDDDALAELLGRLLEEEKTLQNFIHSATTKQLPKSHDKVYWYNNTEDNWEMYPEVLEYLSVNATDDFRDRFNALDRQALFVGPSICHTARLPSKTRFTGTLTNQPEMTGEQAIFGRETYFVGIMEEEFHDQNVAKQQEGIVSDDNHEITLVSILKEREKDCGEELAAPDYHDYFMTHSSEGWTSLTFPNDAEQAAYNYKQNADRYKGMLIIVPRFCGFGQCEEGFLGYREYNEGKWEMVVNGVPVTALTMMGHEAILLEHESGIVFDRNSEGRYDLEFRVNEPNSFIKISAFIMY